MSDKLKKWSVLSYVAAVLHAIVLVLLVIEWVAWKADAFRCTAERGIESDKVVIPGKNPSRSFPGDFYFSVIPSK